MPRFEHEAGPGTTVAIGSRRFLMPHDTENPKEIELLRKFPGVSMVVEYPFEPSEPVVTVVVTSEADLEPLPDEEPDELEPYKKPKASRKEV